MAVERNQQVAEKGKLYKFFALYIAYEIYKLELNLLKFVEHWKSVNYEKI